MRHRFKWVGILCLLCMCMSLVGRMAYAQSPDVKALSAGMGVQPRKVLQLPLTLPPTLTGTLSALVKDPDGFYWSVTDGGPATADWSVRLVKLKVTPAGASVLDVIPLRDEQGAPITGDRLDPEDVVVAPDGTLWLVDEIYPLIVQVSRDGQVLRRVTAPPRYSARVKGRGFEGVALSADGRTLYVMLQTGLSTEKDKSHTWLLAYDTVTGDFREYRYNLDNVSDYNYPEGVTAWIGANALAATADNRLLVLERDNLSGPDARVKRVYRVSVPTTPGDGPLTKELYMDLHAAGYTLEKAEGLAAPNPNTLVVINDNDGDPNKPTVVWYIQY